MSLNEYLQRQPEEMPHWLDQFEDGAPFSRQQFFGSRVVYYPGSGTDGHPVQLFGSTHSAHSFVYADYGLRQADLEAELEHPRYGFCGYHTLARLQLQQTDLVPAGCIYHIRAEEIQPGMYGFATVINAPFGFLEILERDSDRDDNYGARRLAILFLGADGIATYDALFCQRHSTSAPFAVVLQDHGFGGNYDSFGRDSLLERIATRCNVIPRWLLVADNTEPWLGFERVNNVDGDSGGMHNNLRFLYERQKS